MAFSFRPTSTFTVTTDLAFTDTKYGDFCEVSAGGLLNRSGNWANQRIKRFDLSGTLRHVGRRFADNANLRRMDDYTTFDAALGCRLPKGARLMLRGRNLTDALYAVWGVSGGTALRLEAPRSVDVMLTMRF